MTIACRRIFSSRNGEAAWLPKDIAFGDDVDRVLVRSGDISTMYPAGMTIPVILERLRALPRPREIERRDDELLRERSGM